jgi:DNA-directed RNA polymerase specialized sigma24 family protein
VPERLIARHQATLRRFCHRLVGDAGAAQDLVQETLLRAGLTIGRLGEPARFDTWLLGIAAYLARRS